MSQEVAGTGRRARGSKRAGWFGAAFRYYRDPSASVFGKLIAVLALAYVAMPVDLIPDVPVVGWLDDLGVVGLATAWLTRRLRPYREPALGAGEGPPERP